MLFQYRVQSPHLPLLFPVLLLFVLIKYYLGYQITMMSGACSMYGGEENYVQGKHGGKKTSWKTYAYLGG